MLNVTIYVLHAGGNLYVFPGFNGKPRSRRQDFPSVLLSFAVNSSNFCSQGGTGQT